MRSSFCSDGCGLFFIALLLNLRTFHFAWRACCTRFYCSLSVCRTSSVGTMGGREGKWGPCACPACLLASRGRTSTRPPHPPHLTPCPYAIEEGCQSSVREISGLLA